MEALKKAKVENEKAEADKQLHKQKVEEIKKERYLKYLEDDNKAQEMEELSRKERVKALDCMLKVMDHQINLIKQGTEELREKHEEHASQLIDLDKHFDQKENELFKQYHEDRLNRIRHEIEEGLTDVMGLDGEMLPEDQQFSLEELEAHSELRQFAEAIRRRQENYKMVDIAETVVDNKMLINEIDDFLGNKRSAAADNVN